MKVLVCKKKQKISTESMAPSAPVIVAPVSDSHRVVSLEQLQVLNLVVHPLWIFDSVERRMRWANDAGVALWNSSSLEELLARDFTNMSSATAKRLEETVMRCQNGQHVVDQWTYYPKGQAKTVDVTLSGIRLQGDRSISSTSSSSSEKGGNLPYMCLLNEGVAIVQEDLDHEVLRGVEMLRHLPISICQFDMEGDIMFQNPEACLLEDESTQQDQQQQEETEGDGTGMTVLDVQKKTTQSASADAGNEESSSVASEDKHESSGSSNKLTPPGERNLIEKAVCIEVHEAKSREVHAQGQAQTQTQKNTDKTTTTSSRRKRQSRPATHNGTNSEQESNASSIRLDNNNNNNNNNELLRKKKKTRGNLVQRFLDQGIGQNVLAHFEKSEIPLDFEAMVHSQKGKAWSAIQVRQSKDPVTGKRVILYSAQDKSDAVNFRKEREARKQESEFFAVMAHEIRTPLHQVTGFVDLLHETELTKEQQSFVRQLKTSAQGLIAVVNDVLDYSKLEAGEMKLENIPYAPLSVIEGSMEAVRANLEERKLYLNLEWDRTIPFKLKADPNRLRQVGAQWSLPPVYRMLNTQLLGLELDYQCTHETSFGLCLSFFLSFFLSHFCSRIQILLNLLSNAAKFTKQGGITIQATYLKDTSPIQSSCNSQHTNNTASQKQKPMVKFVVKDTGVGISEEHQEHIFHKYHQADVAVARKFGGTGLGLSICQSLVEMMGGSMGVDSQINQGAAFWFILPAELPTEKDFASDNEDETEISPATKDGELRKQTTDSGLHILVAEDNKVNQKLICHMLTRLGHRSTLAGNGNEAIDLVEKNPNSYSLILMDIQMPICDGLEATRRLRTLGYNNLPIYGLTASVARSDFAALGFNDWLPKPIRMNDLKHKLFRLRQTMIAETENQKQENHS